ncbi:hypothetical protein IPT68_20470 [Streptomyces chromofuscus]|uniref:Lipoprotein CseA n=1 Tax=Streptomyces chromofuscus TaxID=42881 RepID=A0A7M2THN9_STRCW|nr:hypothetical protein [Streptomyces chromofuscus]QOV47699.1 hypothetical protein IPT68_20470 [Streptomyces chromofuscus]
MTGGVGVDTGPGPTPARGAFQAVITAVTVPTAVSLLLSACATGGTGARDEGPAHDSLAATAATPAVPASAVPPSRTLSRAEAVKLLLSDPQVSAAVKRDLRPCVADEYPVDLSYGDLTGGSVEDVVVNVVTCTDVVGIGSYVYREEGGSYRNVFRAEEPPVYAEIDRGDLVVTNQVYEKGDPVSSPSGENVITYHWSAGRFTEEYRTRNDYSTVVGAEPTAAPESN